MPRTPRHPPPRQRRRARRPLESIRAAPAGSRKAAAPRQGHPGRRRRNRARRRNVHWGNRARWENRVRSAGCGRWAARPGHASRGRVRIKVPAAKSNPELLRQIRARFEGHPGIEAIDVKQSTGSVIICYDPEHHADVPSLFASLDKAGATPTAHMAPLAAVAAPVHHRPANKLDAEINSIEEEAEFLAEHSHAARVIVEYIKGLDRQIKRSTNNNVDLKILVPVGLAAFTILEIGVATATPIWVTLMLFSINHFVEMHAHDADEG